MRSGPFTFVRTRLPHALTWLRPDAGSLLWLLALVAATPLLMLSVYNVLNHIPEPQDPDTVRAVEARMALANAGGAVQAQLRDAAALLDGLADLRGERCASLLATDLWPAGVAVFRADGALVCAGGVRRMVANASGQEFFRAALLSAGQAPVLAGVADGWITNHPATVMARALPPARPGAPPSGVLAVGVELAWLHQPAMAPSLNLLLLAPRDLVLLAAPGGDAPPLGHRMPWPAMLRQLRLGDSEGVTLLHGTAMLSGLAAWKLLSVPGLPPVVLAAVWPPSDTRLTSPPGTFTLLWQAELMLAVGVAGAWLLVGRRFALWLHALTRGTPLPAAAPATLRAIAARLAAHADCEAQWSVRLAATQAELELIANGASELFEVLDPGFARRAVHGAAFELLGYSTAELLLRRPEDDRPPEDWVRLHAALVEVAAGGQRARNCDTRVRRRDGGLIWLESRLSRLPDGGVLMVSRDVSRWRESEQALAEADRRLATLALEDALTGLANRRRFDAALAQELRRAARSAGPLALALIELDAMEAFRDRHGAARADATLRKVARAVSGALLRPGDIAARLEGDRLALLLPGADQHGAGLVTHRALAAIRAILLTDAYAAELRPRIGIAVAGAEAMTPESIIALAERVLSASGAEQPTG